MEWLLIIYTVRFAGVLNVETTLVTEAQCHAVIESYEPKALGNPRAVPVCYSPSGEKLTKQSRKGSVMAF